MTRGKHQRFDFHMGFGEGEPQPKGKDDQDDEYADLMGPDVQTSPSLGATETPDAELTGLMHHLMPFTAVLGVEALDAAPGLVQARVAWDASRCTTGAILHGGFLMAVADAVGAACAAYNLPTSASTTTLESKTNFLRSVGRGHVRIASSPLYVGTTTLVVQTDLTRDDGRLVARTTQTQAVRGRTAS
jgi:uncharacterized protein (TIGR00369 family)